MKNESPNYAGEVIGKFRVYGIFMVGVSLLLFSLVGPKLLIWLGLGAIVAALLAFTIEMAMLGPKIKKREELEKEARKYTDRKEHYESIGSNLPGPDRRGTVDRDGDIEKLRGLCDDLNVIYSNYARYVTSQETTQNIGFDDINEKILKLFDECFDQIDAAGSIVHCIRQLHNEDLKKPYYDRKKGLIREITETVSCLTKIILTIKTENVYSSQSKLAQLAEELNNSIEVAKKIGDRIRGTDSGIIERGNEAEYLSLAK